MSSTTKQRRKPFDPRGGKSRRREASRPEPYRANGVILAPRRALRYSRGLPVPTNKQAIQEDQ